MLFGLTIAHYKHEKILGNNDDEDVKMLYLMLDYG